MTTSADHSPLRHPAAVRARLLVWPLLIEVLASAVARTQDDALAAGFSAFLVLVALGFVLALADGLVLRTRQLVLVWSVVTVVVSLVVSVQPLVDSVVAGEPRSTWAEAADVALADLPTSLPFFLVLVGVPAALGVLSGLAIGRSLRPRGPRSAGEPRPVSSRA